LYPRVTLASSAKAKFFEGFYPPLHSPGATRTASWRTRATRSPRFSAGLDSTYGSPPKQPLFQRPSARLPDVLEHLSRRSPEPRTTLGPARKRRSPKNPAPSPRFLLDCHSQQRPAIHRPTAMGRV